jgi:hypothetical protein
MSTSSAKLTQNDLYLYKNTTDQTINYSQVSNQFILSNIDTAGYNTEPQLRIDNASTTVGNTIGVPSIRFRKTGRATVVGDIISSLHSYALPATGETQNQIEYSRITTSIKNNTTALGQNGGIQFGTVVNGTMTTQLELDGSGLSITGNISFTGSLGSITQTTFGKIATTFGKQTFAEQGTVITGTTSLSAPFSAVYSVFNGATAFTITIPQASSANEGVILTFRRASGSTSTTAISLTTIGSTQSIYNGVNNGTATFTILGSGAYIFRLVSITNGSTYGWYQI